MKSIIQAMLEQIYIKADEVSKRNRQLTTMDMVNNYYITLEQLEKILKEFED